ncbi:hypothetical protein DL771_007618 [Monosporascus sp. 5C6A]|nr:hypothetical protein DL771_007618 [Monosporascus sp. 5C6A]
MSGRSAYVRKKINDPKAAAEKGSGTGRGRANSSGSGRASSHDDYSIYEQPQFPGTGYGTTNARLLKFSESIRGNDFLNYRAGLPNFGAASQSGGSDGEKGDMSTPRYQAPMPEFAYARARKPVLKTEDVSGIERSGFRSAVDKKSEEVRRGITKAFTFGTKKKKKDSEADLRSPSSLGSRRYEDCGPGYDPEEGLSIPRQFSQPQQAPSATDMEGFYSMSPPPLSSLPPIPLQPNAPPIKRWIGAGRPVQRWNKLRKDPELWDPNGDVLIYFGHKGQNPRPNPSFRLSSHIIEATESLFLITLLREGSTDEDDIHMHMPPSPLGAPPMVRPRGSNQLGPGYGQAGQPTPPLSDDVSLAEMDGQISYEMYFPIPSNLNRIDAHRHAITTRNVFALLYHASLVGFSLHQALSDLLARLEYYMPQDADNVGTLLNYLSARGIDDPRNDPETAVSILAWSETVEVRWEEGWREAFVHCAGMYARLEACADFKSLTPITKALLERACLETQLRVQAAEERLAEFAYGDMWPGSGPVASSPGRAAADRLQKFLVAHYAALYGDWPPRTAAGARTVEGEEMWLTRTVAQHLARDFGSLYDYLVDRDIVWDESEFRSGRKWEMVSKAGNKSFSADTPDLPLTDLLIEFDNRQRFPHIPHPYPLVPESIVPPPSSSARPATSGRKRDKGSSSTSNNPGKQQQQQQSGDERAFERRAQLAYTEATNIYTLGSEDGFEHTPLIDAFARFEKTDHQQVSGAVDPFAARRGRWVLIYGVLQTLASVAVDAPCVRYRGPEGAYHLGPRPTKGVSAAATRIPPWKTAGSSSHTQQDAAHELSYCWTAPASWRSAESEADGFVGSDDEHRYRHRTTSDDEGDGGAVTRMMRFPRPPQKSLPGHHPAWPAHAHQGHGPVPGPAAGARSIKSAATASVVSVRSDDTSGAASYSSGGGRGRAAGPWGENVGKVKGHKSYVIHGHAQGQRSPVPGAPSSTVSAATISGGGLSDGTAADELEWPVRTTSFPRDGAPPSPAPNRPLPLPLPPPVSSSSLASMMAAVSKGPGADAEERSSSRGPPERTVNRGRDSRRDVSDRHRPALHSRGSSDALGRVMRDFEDLSAGDDGDGDRNYGGSALNPRGGRDISSRSCSVTRNVR